MIDAGSRELDPHGRQPVLRAGRPAEEAAVALILVHGRGAAAADMLSLTPGLGASEAAVLAPQALGSSWYPHSFLAPLDRNEPGLSSGLALLAELVEGLEEQGIPAERTVLLGFSQGACLTLEFAARNPRRYGGVVGLTGGLIGPPGTPRDYTGLLEGTPAFLGAGDPDPHVPWWRVEESADVLRGMGATVTLRRYPGMAHTINQQELDRVRRLVTGLTRR